MMATEGPRRRYDREASDGGHSMTSFTSSDVIVEPMQMKKQVGLISGISLIVGTMIGSGIFISPKGVLTETESVGVALIVWSGCGVLAMLGSLCYAELGTMIPKSGGEYPYLMEAYGPIPAYMFSWTAIIVSKTSSLAIICLAFADYTLDPMFDGCGPHRVHTKLLAAIAIITVTLINCYSARIAANVQVFFTFAKLSALAIIIVGGIVKLAQDGGTQYLQSDFDESSTNPSRIALAFYSGLWAYDGWNNLNFVTEEIQNPSRNLPRAILIGIPLVTVVYVLTNISYLTVMSKEELLASPAVASLWGDRVLKGAALILPISVACSTFGAANGTAYTTGRLTYVASREGHLPELMSYISVKTYTPVPSLLVNMVIALLMIIPGDIETLINFFSFASWIFYAGTAGALLLLRYTKPDLDRPYKVPLVIPIVFLLCAIYLVIGPIIDDPQIELLYATIFIVGGLIFYFPFVHFGLVIPGMDSFTTCMQRLLEVSPTQPDLDESQPAFTETF